MQSESRAQNTPRLEKMINTTHDKARLRPSDYVMCVEFFVHLEIRRCVIITCSCRTMTPLRFDSHKARGRKKENVKKNDFFYFYFFMVFLSYEK